jgi:hypothetical protein
MTTWSDSPTSRLGTCWTTYSSLKATSPSLICKYTLNTCVEHGIPNNLLNPCSSRFKTVQIILQHFMSACRRWNEKSLAEKTRAQFKSHFAAAHRQHTQIQGESAATAGYHSANASVGETEDQMSESTIVALANLATVNAADRGVVATLTESNARLVKQLEYNSNELRELKALIKKERFEKCGQRSFNPSPYNYCWTHGYKVGSTDTQGSVATYRNKVTTERPLQQITWESIRPTRNDVLG